MKVNLIGKAETILSNPMSQHNYFAWSTLTRLKNGKIAVGSSGFRLRHICPFGKSVIAISEDEGQTYTAPMPIIDTVLDDRDAGLCPFGDSGLIVTSFNNTVKFQKRCNSDSPYSLAYLDRITPEQERAALGAVFRISFDNGVTFGDIYKSPITSPHGPIELSDGRILWVGRTFSGDDAEVSLDEIRVYILNPNDGSMEHIGTIEDIYRNGKKPVNCEPYMTELTDGRLICHIRVDAWNSDGTLNAFTLYQSESFDKGKTWTAPHQIIGDLDGAPSHILLHSSGVLICTYGCRHGEVFGIRAIFSTDNGESWSESQVIYNNDVSSDLGYPSSVELSDGSILTAFYAHKEQNQAAVIMQQKWSFDL